jgi:hypothetical protein
MDAGEFGQRRASRGLTRRRTRLRRFLFQQVFE